MNMRSCHTLARANYTYDSRYSLSASLRRDGSSRFGSVTVYFWSVGGAWHISNESLYAQC